jgi:4-methyl-5(b-hydroxyethyl)-thiazole monophosphate biosynthesis
MPRIIVPLAEGFEEIEAIAVIDILRRADVEVVVAGVGGKSITGSHGITVLCDREIGGCDAANADGIVLPGGLPGATNLRESAAVCDRILEINESGRAVGAICAAPTVLSSLGLLSGRKATCHPNHIQELKDCVYTERAVVVDGNIVTSRGAGTAVQFAAELVRILVSKEKADEILAGIVAK